MIGKFVEVFRPILLVREKPPDNGLGVPVMEALADDAQLAEADLLALAPGPSSSRTMARQPLFQGPDDIGHQGVQSGGGFDHFPGHEFEAAGGHVVIKELEDDVLDKGLQASGGGQGLIIGAVQGIFFQGPAVGVFQDGGVEPFLVPEMIIDRSQVGPGPAADFPDGGLAKAPGGKDLGRRPRRRRCRVSGVAGAGEFAVFSFWFPFSD